MTSGSLKSREKHWHDLYQLEFADERKLFLQPVSHQRYISNWSWRDKMETSKTSFLPLEDTECQGMANLAAVSVWLTELTISLTLSCHYRSGEKQVRLLQLLFSASLHLHFWMFCLVMGQLLTTRWLKKSRLFFYYNTICDWTDCFSVNAPVLRASHQKTLQKVTHRSSF